MQIAVTQVAQQALLLFRNILVARLLPPEQFGIALTLVTVVSALDAISELGIELYLIRSPDTGDHSLQDTLHSALIARGMLSATALFLMAHPVSRLFGAAEAAWAYQMLAVVPLIRSFYHLDVRRFERDLRFWPGLVNSSVAMLAGTIAAIVLALQLRDYSAMLYATILQTAVLAVGSHLLATRKYRLGRDKAQSRRLLDFGLPLLANGILLFLAMQGDRVIVGSLLGMHALAVYGAIAILTGGVTLLVNKISGSLYLPILSGSQPGEAVYERRYEFCGAISALLAILTMIVFGTVGAPLAQLAYGKAYDLPPLLVVFLGLQSGFRILRSWPQIGFLATASTKSLLIANVTSAIGLAGAAICLLLGLSLSAAAASLALGECLAALVSFLRQRQLAPGTYHVSFRFFAAVCAMAALVAAINLVGLPAAGFVTHLGMALMLATLGVAAVLWCSRSTRRALATLCQPTARN